MKSLDSGRSRRPQSMGFAKFVPPSGKATRRYGVGFGGKIQGMKPSTAIRVPSSTKLGITFIKLFRLSQTTITVFEQSKSSFAVDFTVKKITH